jgi:hypothetical protein
MTGETAWEGRKAGFTKNIIYDFEFLYLFADICTPLK